MPKTIAVIDGHPDKSSLRFVHALADAYASGAEGAGHEVRRIEVSRIEFELLGDAASWARGAPESLRPAQEAILAADHLVFLYPLWMGAMPALLKGFLEQLTAGGFAVEPDASGKSWTRKLKGKSARIIVTMGMPAAAYRCVFGAHSLKSFERNILSFAGVAPIRDTLIGMVEARSDASRARVLERVRKLGAAAR
jgi:putative NADPH-quinone reductase